ncbi:MAG: ABC transporter permease [Clostridiales bacterium]|jgi:simple sugar transport system permease protein|nr:ABC transporter permease [Clostridiales bacterium]
MNGADAIFQLIAAACLYGAPLLFATTGEIITEKSGSLNLGVEGTMAVGAVFGYLAACGTNSLLIGLLVAFITGAACGALFSFLTGTLKANQNVTGLSMTIFGVGLYSFVGETMRINGTFPMMSDGLKSQVANGVLGGLADIPYVGTILFSHNILVYLSVVVAVLVYLFFKKTKWGLRTRAVGENPAAADSVGINVSRTRFLSSTVGSGIMGLGGLYMGMVVCKGLWYESATWIAGYGWIAIALVIFASWSSLHALWGSAVFGLLLALPSKSSLLAVTFPNALGWMTKLPPDLYYMIPFVITALVLILGSIRRRKEGVAPLGIGVNYFREER